MLNDVNLVLLLFISPMLVKVRCSIGFGSNPIESSDISEGNFMSFYREVSFNYILICSDFQFLAWSWQFFTHPWLIVWVPRLLHWVKLTGSISKSASEMYLWMGWTPNLVVSLKCLDASLMVDCSCISLCFAVDSFNVRNQNRFKGGSGDIFGEKRRLLWPPTPNHTTLYNRIGAAHHRISVEPAHFPSCQSSTQSPSIYINHPAIRCSDNRCLDYQILRYQVVFLN